MIVLAAIEQDGKVYVAHKGGRHNHVIHDMVIIHGVKPPVKGTQGFVDEHGKFYNRHDAAQHAFDCGQLSEKKNSVESYDFW